MSPKLEQLISVAEIEGARSAPEFYAWFEDLLNRINTTRDYREQVLLRQGIAKPIFEELFPLLRLIGHKKSSWLSWQIKGVTQSIVTLFSKRHEQIDAEFQKRIERAGRRGPEKVVRRQVAEDKRRRNQKESTADRLRPLWRNQLSPEEAKTLKSVRPQSASGPTPVEVGAAVTWADEHLFERRSLVAEHELLSAALARGRGENFGLDDLRTAVAARGYH